MPAAATGSSTARSIAVTQIRLDGLGREHYQRRNAWPAPAGELAVPVVLAIAGLLFAITGTTARGTNLRPGENTRLVDPIQAGRERNDRTSATGDRLRRAGGAPRGPGRGPTGAAGPQGGDAIAGAAGLTPMTGGGLTVTLDDAPPGAIDRSYPRLPEPTADDLVVHQQDLQAVVNALWAGGAAAIQLMDQRIISTSAVRCVGNVLILQDRVYFPDCPPPCPVLRLS